MLPTFIALGAGLAALAWGLAQLQQLFADETRDARARLADARAALERDASAAFGVQLHEAWLASAGVLAAALRDPLEPASGLCLVEDDVVKLPRTGRPQPSQHHPVVDALARLRGLRPDQVDRTEKAAEDPGRSFAAQLAQALQSPGDEERIGRLQRWLLATPGQFTQGDHDELSRLLSDLAAPTTAAFVERWGELSLGVPLLPHHAREPSLYRAAWYLEPTVNGVRGLKVDPAIILRETAASLTESGRLRPDDRLSLSLSLTEPLEAVSTLHVEVDRPSFRVDETEIARRYRIKNTMIAICGLLALGLTAAGVLGQHRKQRFLELKSDFVATVSHELRTPLASIRLLAETLERRPSDDAIRHYPGRIVRVVDNLAFIVENILSFNKVTKGRWRLDPKPLSFDDVVDDLRADLAVVMPATFTVTKVSPESPGWLADPTLVRLLFLNLGRNACTYNQRTPVELTIRARSAPWSDFVIEFTDNGVGIASAEWENVFHEFYRIDLASTLGAEIPGSGLGLALCRKIMQLHGGSIRVDSSNANGTTFSLTFPRRRGSGV